jgi:ribosome-binding protein aMBF1 (putative translation factor)
VVTEAAEHSTVTAHEPLTGLPEAITAARTQAGSLLSGFRHQAGLSQVQLAGRIGYSATAVAHAELGPAARVRGVLGTRR